MKNKHKIKITEKEVNDTLRKFVEAGVLMYVMKEGELAYINNPKFKEKSKIEQKKIFDCLVKNN